MQFTEMEAIIAAGDSNGSVQLNKDGSVVLDGLMDITVNVGEEIQIVAGNEVTLASQIGIKVINDAGPDLEVKSGEIKLHGGTILWKKSLV